MSSFLVDTDVLSEARRPAPNPKVLDWMEKNRSNLYISAFTIADLAYGINRLPAGRKREELRGWFEEVRETWEPRTLRFDSRTATVWGELQATLEQRGQLMPVQDSYIAAIAKRHTLRIATRNTRDFAPAGIPTVNPFSS